MKQKLVLLLLAGALIMNGSGVQTDTGKNVETAENQVKEETDSTGFVENSNPEEITNAETNMNSVQEEIMDTETSVNSIQESRSMTEEDFSLKNEKSEEELEKQTFADSEKKASIEEAENRSDLGENSGTEEIGDREIDHAASEDAEKEKNDPDMKEKNAEPEQPSQNLEEGDSDKQPEEAKEAKEDRPDGNRAESNITDSNIPESGKDEPQITESESDESQIGESTNTKPETGEMNSADPEKSKEQDEMIQSGRIQEELKQKEGESLPADQSAAKQTKQPPAKQMKQPAAKQKEQSAAEQTKQPAAKQKEQPAAEQTKQLTAKQKEQPAAKQKEQPAAEQTKQLTAEQKEKPAEEQTEVTVSETSQQMNTDKKGEKEVEAGEQTPAIEAEETAVGAEEPKKIQKVLNTEKLKSMLDSARIGISENKDSEGKNKMVLRLEGAAFEAAKPVKVKIQLIRENGAATGNAGGQENQILVTREIVSKPGAEKTEAEGEENRVSEEPWEMEILSREDTGKILQEIPDNDGFYRIAVTYEDEEGNTASRDIPFTVNRFGSVYVYSQSCKDLQDSYVQSVDRDLVISEYNPDRLVAKSLKVEIIRDGEPLGQVLYEVHSGEDDKQEDRKKKEHKQEGRKGWYRYDYIISRKNFEKDGIYQVSVSSADEAGNKPDSMDYYQKPILFRVDSTNPEVDIIRQAERSMKVNAENILRYQAFDAIRLKNIRVLVDGKLQQEISDIPEVTNYQGTVRLTGLRKHKVQIVLTDMAGNSYRSEEQLVYGIPVWLYLIMGIFCAGAIVVSSLVVIFRKSKRLRLRVPHVIKP